MTGTDDDAGGWRKSSRSGNGPDCVEVRFSGGEVHVRNSRDPTGPHLIFTRGEWAAFADGIAEGELRG
jgi:hypothetical protein